MSREAKYITNARLFLNNFLDFCASNPFAVKDEDIEYGGYSGIMHSAIIEYNMVTKSNIKYNHGAVRTVLIGSNFVIKKDTVKTSRWKTAFGGCEKELLGYKKACESGFDFLFCPITKIRCFHEKCQDFFYIMPRLLMCADDGEFFGDYIEGNVDPDAYDFVTNNFFDLHNENFGFNEETDTYQLIDYAANYFKE